jgi:hypothetical protein
MDSGEAQKLVASGAFKSLWTAALRSAHQVVTDFLKGEGALQKTPEGALYVDLSEASKQLTSRLQDAGVPISEDLLPTLVDGRIPIAQVDQLEAVRSLVDGATRLFFWLPVIAVVLFAGSVVAARDRRKGLARVGVGLMVTMALLVVALGAARVVFLQATAGAGFPDDAAGALWSTLTLALRASAWGIFVLGALLCAYPFVVRLLRGERVHGLARTAEQAGWNPGSAGAWVSAHRTLLNVAVLILGFVVLAAWGSARLVPVVVTAVSVVAAEAAVFFVAALSDGGDDG